MNAFRGSPYVVPRADARVFTAALVPEDEAGLKSLVGSASAKEVIDEGYEVGEALSLVAAAAREGLGDGPLDRDAFHQAMRERLPDGLLPWCRGCQSHHVRPGFWRALGPLEVTVMPEKATWALADPPSMSLDEARAELVRRFLRVFGPATHSQLASWAQTAAVACEKALRGSARGAGGGFGRGPAGVRARLRTWTGSSLRRPRQASACSAATTPTSRSPTAKSLVPDAALRKQLFPPVGRPGVVLADGVLTGLWRGHKKGDVLEVSVEWLGEPVDIAEEAAAIAAFRGCSEARVV